MAPRIEGDLYYEVMGRSGPAMVFVHPNPLDQSAWLYQLTHFSTWYRCVTVDIPGYGRSPTSRQGVTLSDMAIAVWEAVDRAVGTEAAILVGSSAGSAIVQQMYHEDPARTLALVLSATGYSPDGDPEWRAIRASYIDGYRQQGPAYRSQFGRAVLSEAFRDTPLAQYLLDILLERNNLVDVPSIVRQFEALERPRGPQFFTSLACPALILSGTEDMAHPRASKLQEMMPNSELRTLPGAGHACHLEQPWLFDTYMLEFLRRQNLFPGTGADLPVGREAQPTARE
jgi:pimeloyl-ACP methyl ester carboxylesterase